MALLRSRRRRIFLGLLATIAVIAIFSYFTNPFVRFSLVRDPNQVVWSESGELSLSGRTPVILRTSFFTAMLAKLKAGYHIVGGRVGGGQKAQQQSVDEIIREIHLLRFNPDNPFIISGDHFSVLYPRSLGIFYHSLLDPRTALDETDWRNRQAIYLKTTAYALEVFAQSESLSTTIIPVGPQSVVLANFYAPPSDTLFSLLYALKVMADTSEIEGRYPFTATPAAQLQTGKAGGQLLVQYDEALKRHYQRYRDLVYDEPAGLLKKYLHLSGTKDITIREGAFYDNVIFWKTTKLAQELGLIDEDKQFLDSLKQRILSTYWIDDEGLFLEDLSDEGRQNRYYSSDWLIAFQTGFLDPRDPADRAYLEKAVAYIERNAIDQPFGLQYHPDLRRHRQYGLVRWGAPSYGSTAIWSNWGMEYIKLLTLLARETKQTAYLNRAERQLEAYTFNIKRYRGYPEVYDEDGDFYRTPFYKSVRQTGWVVTYEQARALLQSVAGEFSRFSSERL